MDVARPPEVVGGGGVGGVAGRVGGVGGGWSGGSVGGLGWGVVLGGALCWGLGPAVG